MSLPVKMLVLSVAGLMMILGIARAQLLPTWQTHITLTQQDLELGWSRNSLGKKPAMRGARCDLRKQCEVHARPHAIFQLP